MHIDMKEIFILFISKDTKLEWLLKTHFKHGMAPLLLLLFFSWTVSVWHWSLGPCDCLLHDGVVLENSMS